MNIKENKSKIIILILLCLLAYQQYQLQTIRQMVLVSNADVVFMKADIKHLKTKAEQIDDQLCINNNNVAVSNIQDKVNDHDVQIDRIKRYVNNMDYNLRVGNKLYY